MFDIISSIAIIMKKILFVIFLFSRTITVFSRPFKIISNNNKVGQVSDTIHSGDFYIGLNDYGGGAITLVSAAGSASYQTFTVTNLTVAATDTIIINQKSGTDKYIILVTNIAAGSFSVTFATTGGTTTEQPVFNFAVIKAVTA